MIAVQETAWALAEYGACGIARVDHLSKRCHALRETSQTIQKKDSYEVKQGERFYNFNYLKLFNTFWSAKKYMLPPIHIELIVLFLTRILLSRSFPNLKQRARSLKRQGT